MEIGNLPEEEFRMIVKMIQDLGKRMDAKMEKMQKMYLVCVCSIGVVKCTYPLESCALREGRSVIG